ncbi:MAG: hypothetical protein ABI885_17580 [Gammaproteobacteria bacterium]
MSLADKTTTGMKADPETEQAIARANRQAEALFAQGEMNEVAKAYYTEDSCYVTPDQKILRGRAAIAEFLTEVSRSVGATRLRLEPLITCSSFPHGGYAYQVGNGILVRSDGQEIGTHYLCIFRKVGQEWFCETDMSNFGLLPG